MNETHTDWKQTFIYIFTNPTSPHERFCPRWFHSECKEAILEKTSTNIDTEIQKRHKGVKRGAALHQWKPLLPLVECVFSMNVHTCTYTCPEVDSFLPMVLEF